MTNKKVGIAGAGNMGLAISWAMEQLGYDLIILDQDENALYNCQQILSSKHKFVRSQSFDCLKDCRTVISSLPFHQTLALAYFCIPKKITYCDLGGNIETSNTINHFGNHSAKAIVMTDLGLAPGWVNLIAENMYQEYASKHDKPPQNIKMMVGGLPQHPNNTLKYSCTWSYDGLVNEYRDDCVVLSNGEQITANGMEGYEFPIVSNNAETRFNTGPLEAFYTSGGAAHTIATMQRRGVLNCSYKTLRYPNHHTTVNFLINESGLDDQSIIDIFKKTCPPQDDLVIILVRVDDLNFEKIIKSDSQFSAMQKSTAFPIAAAAHTIAISDIEKPVLKYSDLTYPQFNKTLEQLFEKAI